MKTRHEIEVQRVAETMCRLEGHDPHQKVKRFRARNGHIVIVRQWQRYAFDANTALRHKETPLDKIHPGVI